MDKIRHFGFLLNDVTKQYILRFEARARTLGLTLSQCKVLTNLARNEGISQSKLSDLADIEPMNLVRILDQMEAHGWLERRTDPADRRARRLFLKPKAKPVEEDIWSVAEATRADAFSGIPRQQLVLLIDLLEKMRENFASLESVTARTAADSDVGAAQANSAPARRHRSNSKLPRMPAKL